MTVKSNTDNKIAGTNPKGRAKPGAGKKNTPVVSVDSRLDITPTEVKTPSQTRKTPARAPARKAAPAAKAPARKPPVKKVASTKGPAKKDDKTTADRKLAGIRGAAAEIIRRLSDVETARLGLEESFRKRAHGNIGRVRSVVDTLDKLVSSGPMVDPRRLDRDLAMIVAECSDVKSREMKGRKRDLFAVDEFLDKSAQRLEAAVTNAAAANLRLLTQRIGDLESTRGTLQKAVEGRFRARLDASRGVLTALEGTMSRLKTQDVSKVAGELEKVLSLLRAVPVSKLEGRPKDLFRLDFIAKQTNRRLKSVRKLLEPGDASAQKNTAEKAGKKISGKNAVPPAPALKDDD